MFEPRKALIRTFVSEARGDNGHNEMRCVTY